MAINIFEGARRITKLVALGGLIWFGIFVFTDTPYGLLIRYKVIFPDVPPVLLSEEQHCEDALSISRDSVSTSSGKNVGIIFCFEKEKTGRFQGLIFYKTEKGTQASYLQELEQAFITADDVGNIIDAQELATEIKKIRAGNATSPTKFESYYRANKSSTPEVTEYTKRTINAFVIPRADEKHVGKQWWSKRWDGIRDATFNLAIGLGILFTFTWAVGWIMRGFMGIPRGLDKKPSDNNS